MELLEREPFFDEMAAIFDEANGGGGRVTLVSGEAGVGKTSLVEQFTGRRRDEARVLWGACDALFTPRPLGPLYDVARQTRGALLRRLEEESPRAAIFAAFLDELQSGARPVIAVIEDVHWADEATLDLLKFLGRRIERVPAMLIVTYRDDEVSAAHPLRSVLGDLPFRAVSRLRLGPLSEEAVESLARRAGRRIENLYAVTGGNPFFVTEALANRGEGAPPTVRDAVLARARRLSADAQAALELVSIVPARAEKWLLDEVINPSALAALATLAALAASTLDECLNAGMLRLEGAALAFRHELARLAIADSIPALRRRSLHREVLKALSTRGPEQVQLARLVHHAAQAGDEAAVLQFAPLAARQAAALGAHREAATQYQAALPYAGGLPAEQRARLFGDLSYEYYLTDQIEEAIEARRGALEIWRRLDRRREMGESLSWLSRLVWFSGRRDEAERYAMEAVAALEKLRPGAELAMAWSNLAQLRMLAGEFRQAVCWGTRAIELAERSGATETLAHALHNVGNAQLISGDEQGRKKLKESLRLALANDLREHAARAFASLASACVRERDYEPAMSYFREGIAYATEHDLEPWLLYMMAWRARAHFERGDWNAATDDASWALGHYRVSAIAKVPALAVIGHVRARRGDPDPAAALDEALELATRVKDLRRLAPVAAARAEAAWRRGAAERTIAEARDGFDLAIRHGDSRDAGELGFWLWRAGALAEPPKEMAGAYALQIAGCWRAAAEMWERVGCPYEQAMALADGDEAAQRSALEIFERLGAGPAAEDLRRRLRAAGVRGLPRGPRPSTRENPLGLTIRQMEVLALLAKGSSNTDIAVQLFISAKTVDHHVSAILAKFDAHSRAEAVAQAQQRGILTRTK